MNEDEYPDNVVPPLTFALRRTLKECAKQKEMPEDDPPPKDAA